METILKEAKKNKYLFIGEMHGTEEIPAVTLQIMQQLAKERTIVFCTELPQQIEPYFTKFFQHKITKNELFSSIYLKDALFDNRFNDNILHLYIELQRLGITIKYLEDYSLDDIYKRDEIMADTFKEIITKENADLFVIYAGNMHVMGKSMSIQNFTINPIKIYLDKAILRKSLTIQFSPGKYSLYYDKKTKTFNYVLPIKKINARLFPRSQSNA